MHFNIKKRHYFAFLSKENKLIVKCYNKNLIKFKGNSKDHRYNLMKVNTANHKCLHKMLVVYNKITMSDTTATKTSSSFKSSVLHEQFHYSPRNCLWFVFIDAIF